MFPAERIDFILDNAGCRYVIVDDQSHVSREGIQLISISALEQNLQTYPSSNPGRTILPTDAAYVIYTSGSTGTPKGVKVSHENLLNFSLGMSQGLSLTKRDHILAITSISFDISFLELIWSLCVGIELTIHTSRPQLGGFNKILPPSTLDFSLFYFSNQENAGDTDKYNFVLETSKYADKSGYSALWIPERHFHEFGGIFPNTAILGAALGYFKFRKFKIV